MTQSTATAEVLSAAASLLDDLENPATALETILLKSRRLARLANDPTMSDWLDYEFAGYGEQDHCRNFMLYTRRDSPGGPYYISGTALAATIQTFEEELAVIRMPDVSGDYALVTVKTVLANVHDITENLNRLRVIETAIRSYAYSFALKHFYRSRVDDRQTSMFNQAQLDIDELLNVMDGRTLQRLDSAYERLVASDGEAITHALTSCRRLLELAADALFPATDETRELGGQIIRLTQDRSLNRLRAFIDDHVTSGSARTRMKQQLGNLFDRTSAGVHSDVTAAEARYIFLNVYTALGELVQLRDRPEPAVDVEISL